MTKKGAIELSMSTIIVVILGITLLSLGLIWIRGTLGKVNDLSEGAFSLAKQEITDIFESTNSALAIKPDAADIKKDNSVLVGTIFGNLGTVPETFYLETTPQSEGIDCYFDDLKQSGCSAGVCRSDVYTINSGNFERIKLITEVNNAASLGYTGCRVKLYKEGASELVSSSTFTVKVIV